MSEKEIKEYLTKKLKMPELVEAAFNARHQDFGYNTFREWVDNHSRFSQFRRNVNIESCWKEVMDFLVKRYGP